jgi:hypothetical protein
MATHKKKSSARRKKTALSPAEAQQQFYLLIEDFFSDYHLKEVDDHLWSWLTAGITCEHSIYDNGKERSNLLFFYENLSDLLHDMWRLHSIRQNNNS